MYIKKRAKFCTLFSLNCILFCPEQNKSYDLRTNIYGENKNIT